jgi:hypothetical protein
MFFRWLNVVRGEFKTLMTGSLLLTAMGFAQGLWQVPIPRWCYVAVTGCFLGWAFYRTWLKEHSASETVGSAKETEVETLRGEKDAEIAALNERIANLSRKPYTEELKRITKQVLDHEMTLEGRHALGYLMIHEPVEVGRVFIPGIPQDRQHAQLAIAMQHGIVQHREERQGLLRTYWIINPRFRPVLEDLLYENGRL